VTRLYRFVVYSLRIRRVEYRVAELPIFLIPVFLLAQSSRDFTSVPFIEGLLVFLFLFALGDLVNCLADRELDSVYKPHLTEAVMGIGIRGVIIQAVVSAMAAILLSGHLAWILDRWILFPATLLGCGLAVAYSVEPIRLKKRSLWQLAFYWLGLFTGPMVFAALILDASPHWTVYLVCFTFGMMQTGIILVNTAEDFPEDRTAGVNTVIVELGLLRGIRLGYALATLGSIGLIAVMGTIIFKRSGSVSALAVLLPLLATSTMVIIQMRLLSVAINGKSEDDAVAIVRANATKVPLWISGQALASCLTAWLIFVWM
jgi:4-hydroxybenzoate polyprenyltransferase